MYSCLRMSWKDQSLKPLYVKSCRAAACLLLLAHVCNRQMSIASSLQGTSIYSTLTYHLKTGTHLALAAKTFISSVNLTFSLHRYRPCLWCTHVGTRTKTGSYWNVCTVDLELLDSCFYFSQTTQT